MDKPTLSVYISNYNHAQYIGESLDSVLAQSFRPLEVVVIDDCSTDNSVEVIESYARCHPVVQLLRNSRNIGPILTEKRALEIVRGEYVFGHGADDKVLPGFFEKSMSLLARYPQAGLCCSDPATFNGRTGTVNENRLYWNKKPCYFSSDELIKVIQGGWIAGHTAIIRRDVLLKSGGCLPELRWHSDWFLLLVIAFRYGICYIPEGLAAFRMSESSYATSGRKNWAEQKEVIDRILYYLKSTEYKDVLRYFRRGQVFYPLGWELIRLLFANRKHWNLETLSLVPLRLMLRDMVVRMAPRPARRLYRKIFLKR